jgi:hypothetical protein
VIFRRKWEGMEVRSPQTRRKKLRNPSFRNLHPIHPTRGGSGNSVLNQTQLPTRDASQLTDSRGCIEGVLLLVHGDRDRIVAIEAG